MKKFIAVLFVVFVANFGCKKMDEGNRLCACSPIQEPTLVLVLKNAENMDVLNPNTNGYFATNNIQLYYQEEGETQKQLNFYIRPSFSYGNEKFDYYQLYSSEIIRKATTANQNFYLKMGNNEPIKLNVEFDGNQKYLVSKLLVNGTEADAEKGGVVNYVRNIFYIKLP